MSLGCCLNHLQAQEWYQEGAVGRAVKHATRVSRSTESETLTSSCIAVEPEDGSGSGCIDDVVHGPGVNGEHASASGALSRGDVFVTTKVHPRDFSSDRLRVMLEASRTKLDVRDGIVVFVVVASGVCV